MLGSVRCALARNTILKPQHAFGRLYVHQRCGLASLVYVEAKGSSFDEGALNAISAARKLSGPVSAVVAGAEADVAAKAVSKIEGLSKVIVAKDGIYDHALPETNASLLKTLQEKDNITHIFAPHSAAGKNIMPRLSALLDSQQISDIIAIEDEDTFVRPVYAGNAIATVKTSDAIKVITVRTTAFPAASASDSATAPEEAAPATDASPLSKWIKEDVVKNDRPDLSSAKRVVSGGRAVKSAEGFNIIYELADKLGAAVGASRAAVDAGYCDNSLQVGQTGRIVAPELYIAIGISGAIQHLAGMKDSKVIVAINKDADAPIFQIADYGLVGDLFTILPELKEKL
ncbi:Electron transfer flavoprotein alpha-subunit [Coemansia sp. RSA 1813]|nr:Electron transfer flavoprotein alpha-subunit [Coemansia sp. RSA 1646]KAJ1773440.1 Electron transfer flavoprotein alpha-subunit [Coemansia sp. RSA 1843]KAJ2091305.1 Electron transfer flavoprotein alpha-subunit [Coemansia sp. RSA 986]KAJ2216496.1 Electron transfer flavoprotein alpha-subunit [Coemansia sp. RSA 487]KAJ2571421.1 Electron transfer flavoprotein alpha-subunit [Coemansia sp. RSA 1813]